MNRNSLFLRLFLGNLLVNILVIIVAGLLAYRALEYHYVHETENYQGQFLSIASQYVEHVWPLPDDQMDAVCKEFPVGRVGDALQPVHGIPVRLTVIAADGRVLGDTLADRAGMNNYKAVAHPEFLDALAGRTGRDVRRSELVPSDYRYMAVPLRHNGDIVGVVRIGMPLVAMLRSEALMGHALLWAALLAVVGFTLMGLLLNWIWYAPVKQIVGAARAIATGDLSHPVPVPKATELAQLAEALNDMRGSLAAQIKTLTTQRENLGQVVANLREGVIALDDQGRVVLMNQDAVDLLASESDGVAGRPIEAVVPVAAIVDAYREAMGRRRNVNRQVDIDLKNQPRHLEVDVRPLTAPGGEGLATLVVVRDVTDTVRAAAMKVEFVANASHELRTPLATMRAAVDSLATAEPSDTAFVAKAAAILDRHLRRLEGLARDLLDLHVVESAKRPLQLEPIDMDSLADWVRSQFADRAVGKGVALVFDVPRGADAFTADRRLVELIIQNLVDNAIKFTPAGGSVTCGLQRQSGRAVFRISDTGCGIRREDRSRVFDRFFQADAARSGDTRARGTGLGLAIVKHACDRLDATVNLESDLGLGTTVTVIVPDHAGPSDPAASRAGDGPSVFSAP